MQLRLIETLDAHAYDQVVRSAPITSALQGWGFGEARKSVGYQPYRFLLQRGEEVVGALQLLRKPLLPGLSLLYAPRGPVLHQLDDLDEVAYAIKRWARSGDLSVKIELPYPVASDAPIPDRYGVWERTAAEQPEHTIATNLTLSEDQLFGNLHSMVRRNVRTAQKLGVIAARDDNFEDFWEVFEATNQRAQLGQYPKSYYQTMLREANAYGGEAYVVLARHEGRALAGGFFLAMGKGVYYLYGGSIRDDRPTEDGSPRKDVKAPTAFYWQAMMDAKARGYEFFDFWGIPRQLSEEKHSFGIYKMKENFGGDRLWYPAYSYHLNPLAPVVYKALRLRKNYLNYRKRGTTEDVL